MLNIENGKWLDGNYCYVYNSNTQHICFVASTNNINGSLGHSISQFLGFFFFYMCFVRFAVRVFRRLLGLKLVGHWNAKRKGLYYSRVAMAHAKERMLECYTYILELITYSNSYKSGIHLIFKSLKLVSGFSVN